MLPEQAGACRLRTGCSAPEAGRVEAGRGLGKQVCTARPRHQASPTALISVNMHGMWDFGNYPLPCPHPSGARVHLPQPQGKPSPRPAPPPPPAASWQRLAGGGPGPLPLQPSGDCPDPQAPLPRDNPTRQRETPAGAPYAERTPKGGPKSGFELRAAQPCRQPLGPPGSGSTGPGLQGQKGRATTVRGPLRPQGLGKGPLSAPEPDPRALSQAAVCPPLK